MGILDVEAVGSGARRRRPELALGGLGLALLFGAAACSRGSDDAATPGPETPPSVESPTPDESTPDGGEPSKPDETPDAKAETENDPMPLPPLDRRRTLADGLNQFTFELYGASKPEDNFCLSPYSAAMALGLLNLGAREETRRAIDRALHVPEGDPAPLSVLGAMLPVLEGGSFERYGETIAMPELIGANSLWTAENYPLAADFEESARRDFSAEIDEIDVTKPAESANRINAWVSDKTRGKIKDLLNPASIGALTRMVVVNAIYLKAAWREPFFESATTPAVFHADDGSKPEVPMMRRGHFFATHSDELADVIELPYWGDAEVQLTMVLALPRADRTLAELEAGLDATRFRTWIDGLKAEGSVQLSLPRWKTETTQILNAPLSAVGMEPIFGTAADFSGVSSEPGLHVDIVLQKTFIEVDEKGTEAAAATAIMLAGSAAPAKPKELVFDRPFWYAIRESNTGVVLFVGRVTNPSQ